MNSDFAVHSATLRVPTKVKNSVGQTVYNYNDYATFQCYIRDLSEKEKIENAKIGIDATLKLYCDKVGMPFDIGCVIISDDKKYNVVGVNNQIKTHWEVMLKLAS
jgi:SPP1 family predicted phage head-tail adaptor